MGILETSPEKTRVASWLAGRLLLASKMWFVSLENGRAYSPQSARPVNVP